MILMAPDTVHSPDLKNIDSVDGLNHLLIWLENIIKSSKPEKCQCTLGLKCDVIYRRFTNQPILETSISSSTTIGAVVLRTHYMIKFNSDPN